MSPPISKDWWVAAALSSAALPAAIGQQAAAGGPAAAPRPAAIVTTGVVGQRQSRPPIYIESARGQKLTTGPNETMHVLFSDQSAITVGPNSEVVIAEYRFDNQAKDGNILIDLSKGLLRVVGGFISKKAETQVRTSTATIGIRGGISLVENNGQSVSATFLFGQQMRASNTGGNAQSITRPGFSVNANSNGISQPQRANTNQLNQLLASFDSPTRNQGVGAPPPPSGGQGGGTLPGSNTQASQLSNDRLPNRQDPGFPTPGNPQSLRDVLNSQTPVAS